MILANTLKILVQLTQIIRIRNEHTSVSLEKRYTIYSFSFLLLYCRMFLPCYAVVKDFL